MQKRNWGLLTSIYSAATLIGALLNWTGITIAVIVYGLFLLRESTKIPFLAMSAAVTGRRQIEYAGPLFLCILLMLVLGFLSNHYGWQHISAFLAQTFLRQ